MTQLITFLSGKKTYFVALVSALVGVWQVFHGTHLNATSVSAFLAAGGLASLRAAVAKVELALKSK